MSPRLEAWLNRIITVAVHAACSLVIWVGFSWPAFIVCIALYLLRGFGITGGYHRFFSHRSFKTSRFFQACLGILGASAMQGGPLIWSRWHRHHHQESDEPEDLHSPFQPNFWWAHMGWILAPKPQVSANVSDLERCPELVWIERLQGVIIAALIAGLLFLGRWLGADWGTSGLQMVVWGFAISTVITWHITWCVNSVAHTWGSRRFETEDGSRNNWLLGIFALGEGHHNNHHAHQGYCRQGLFWWEIDLTYYVLKTLSRLGIVWDLNEPEPEVYVTVAALESVRRELNKRGVEQQLICLRLKTLQTALDRPALQAKKKRALLHKLHAEAQLHRQDFRDSLKSIEHDFYNAMLQAQQEALA